MKKKNIMYLAFSGISFAGVGAAFIIKNYIKNMKERYSVKRLDSYYKTLNQWLFLKNEGKNLEEYFLDNEYKNIAVYGLGELGHRLIEELRHSSINIKYAIDQNSESIFSEFEVLSLDDNLPDVDAVIVTPIFDFNDIKQSLEDKINCNIISLEDIVYELS